MNNNYLKKMLVLMSIMILPIVFSSCSKNESEVIVIKGSTTVLPISQKAAEEYMKKTGARISLEGSGSGNGIKAIIEGGCDIANSSREIKESEIELAKSKGIALKEIAIAYDMIIPVVHPSNKLEDITINQLKAIYDGSIKSWKILNGSNDPVISISRDTSSGTYEAWQEKVMNKTNVRKDALLQASSGAVFSAVKGNPKAIGYLGFGYIAAGVKPLSIDGIPGTIENGKNGKFPLSRKLYIYVNEKSLKDSAKKFIDYLLSDEGQRLVKETGFIPVRDIN